MAARIRAIFSGRSMGNCRYEIFYKFKNVLFPNESEQSQIGEFFNRLDTLIEKEEAAIERFESLKKGYLKRIFAD
jgi:restriction endonuclease S subunit